MELDVAATLDVVTLTGVVLAALEADAAEPDEVAPLLGQRRVRPRLAAPTSLLAHTPSAIVPAVATSVRRNSRRTHSAPFAPPWESKSTFEAQWEEFLDEFLFFEIMDLNV
ncbi:hypothetical protein KQH49_07645 [Mycetohabitans sp. B5]|uniref:hypothetical protein n=1 Tax=Mycetohabitans sp. B5 TaxID=2841846 RepID=UPI000CE2EF08|nr:hypothetical protein [Mycetohabitans sp. B5]MCG1054832.1 hypothetical protein [Mycetohabitans sp. B5]